MSLTMRKRRSWKEVRLHKRTWRTILRKSVKLPISAWIWECRVVQLLMPTSAMVETESWFHCSCEYEGWRSSFGIFRLAEAWQRFIWSGVSGLFSLWCSDTVWRWMVSIMLYRSLKIIITCLFFNVRLLSRSVHNVKTLLCFMIHIYLIVRFGYLVPIVIHCRLWWNIWIEAVSLIFWILK